MRRRHSVNPRRVIFIGVEGASDRAFVRFLGKCCERKGLHLHLNVKPASGGDSVAVVEAAARYVSRQPSDRHPKLVLLDMDRIEQDRRAGRDARSVASKHGLEVILQNPNLEGLLLRLHRGHERQQIQAQDVPEKLQRIWPEYSKPPTVDQLDRRFDVSDLLRAAEHDQHLQRLLTFLGLWE